MADEKVDRRDFLKGAALASSGIAYLSLEEKALLASPPEAAEAKPAAGEIKPAKDFPAGKIGNVTISRLICGGNLISGFAHCRDLLYVSELLRNYFTDEKVMETFRLCEANGINTAVLRLDKHCVSILEKYRKQGGRIQWIVQVSPQEINSMKHDIKWAVDSGAIGAYLHGGAADRWVLEGNRVDLIEQFVKFTREQGIIVGVGAH